jgi:peptide/nickel transport system substrate-binding protein
MSHRLRFGRPLAAAAVALGIILGAWGLPRIGLGRQAPTAPGEPIDLLKTMPFDRITLVDNTVLNVEPLAPRPLPPFDPKKERARAKKLEEKDKPPEEGNIVLPGERKKAAEPKPDEAEQISQINIHTLEGEVRDFRVKRIDIKRIDYFEDFLMAEGERLVRARQFAKAFEYYLAVQLRNPKWRGLDERVNRLLFEEGSEALRDNDGERGLRLLGELFVRKSDYPALADKLATAYGERINKAFDLGLFARGRQILHELEQFTRDHPVVKATRERFIAKAQGLMDKAAKAQGGERVDALYESLRVWPELPGAAAAFNSAFTALPTLDVAVADLPRPLAPWIRSPAGERTSRLVYLPVLAADSEAANRGTLPGQLVAGLDKANLGRRLDIRLREGVTWSDGSRPVTSIDIVRSLSDRTDPRSPAFNARWADLLERVQATDESQVEVHLRRAVLKSERWLLGPVGPAHAAWDGWVTTEQGRQPIGDGPFRWESGTNERAYYVASRSDGETGASPARVRRIREIRHPSAAAALAAFLRGDVTMIEHVPPDRVEGLSKSSELRVGHLELPSLHRIALDGRNPVLRNRQLRRGLSYAIDRKTLLEEILLHHAADEVNAVSDGPFAKGSYADAPGVKPLGYDPLLSKMLIAAAHKELGGQPLKLTFEYPATPEAQAVVPKIAESFRRVGVEIDTLERPESQLEEELRAGRRFDLAYRATRCAEPIYDAGPLLCPGYDAPPDSGGLGAVASPRTLELLLRLERSTDMPSANGLVVAIDRESHDELPVLPLWQLQDYFAWRPRLKGPVESSALLYQGIDAWEIEPWFAKDPW